MDVNTGKIALLCSGQAGQRSGMLDELLGNPRHNELSQLASDLLGQDVCSWWRSLGEDEIYANSRAQFAIALYQLATWDAIRDLLPKPALVAGYSLGEVAACYVAGALNRRETLRIIRERARLMDLATAQLRPGRGAMMLWRYDDVPERRMRRDAMMAALGIDTAIVRGCGEAVLSGRDDAIHRLLDHFSPTNPSLVRLPVAVPSHSRHLAGAVEPLRRFILEGECAAPAVPLLSSLSGQRITSREGVAEALSVQLASTVRWDLCMAAMARAAIDTVIELGPGTDLARLLMREYPHIRVCSVDEFPCLSRFETWLEEHQA